jgi:hypothetical protein
LRANFPFTNSSMRSPVAVSPRSISIFITSALAPPCSGPLSVPMAATTAE